VLVVVVVARPAVISLRGAAISCLLSIGPRRRTAVALLSTLSAEASLRAIAVLLLLLRLLALAVAALGLVLWRAAVLAGRGRGVALLAAVLRGLTARLVG
jgi:hypothetical protein